MSRKKVKRYKAIHPERVKISKGQENLRAGRRNQNLDVDTRTQVPTEELKIAPLLDKKDLKKGITG